MKEALLDFLLTAVFVSLNILIVWFLGYMIFRVWPCRLG